MSTDQDTTRQLGNLLERTVNAREAYKNASKNVHNKPLTLFFEDAAGAHEQFAQTLKQEVERLGGDGKDKTNIKSEADRFWIDFASIIVRRNESAILKACARAEASAIEQYDAVLKGNLSGEIHEEVSRQRAYASDLLSKVDDLLRQYSSD